MKTWIMTVRVADHNQHGEYFVAAFNRRPSVEELESMDFNDEDAEELLIDGQCGILDGEGSRQYYLSEKENNFDHFEEQQQEKANG